MKNDSSHRTIIKANHSLLYIPWRELIEYRDLLFLLVRRDFVSIYKQTILGPLWFVLQPLVTTLVFTVVFGQLAKIPTDGITPFIFYMSGTVLWAFFQGCMDGVSQSLINNSGLFGKVYIPRLIPPLAIVLNNIVRLALSFSMFLLFWIYYLAFTSASIHPNPWLIAFPFVVIECAALGLGIGLWLAGVTAKYRDLRFALPFLAQLWMYATPIVYPASIVPSKFHWLMALNPMAGVVEFNRYAFFGVGTINAKLLLTGAAVTIVLLMTGILYYNRIQRTFIDTV